MTEMALAMQARLGDINLYVVHPFNHVIVALGYKTREIVHTIYKEDSWNCFLSFVFEAP